MEFSKSYNPKEFEDKIYENWEKNDKFKPKKWVTGKTFYVPMPPPNVTWVLHIWHSLALTIEDLMTRYHRMKWDETVYIPWTDHAWIATQSVVEKKLAKEGKKRQDFSREDFIKEILDWVEKSSSTIKNQTRLIGTSCDWSKDKFTLDSDMNKIVEYIFVDLYKKWLIYRWDYMVNYSPSLQTVLSDIEVNYEEEEAKMYYITYFVSWSDNELTIATTRPETLLADQAVAVHPKDKRYKKLIWKKVILPILNKEIPIIGDESVEKDFWTWVLKITPAHDPADFTIGQKHKLKLDYRVIDNNWIMTKESWIFAGQDFMTARENVVELLKAKWNLVKIEPYTHKVWYCSRSWCKIETIISTQWFIKSSELAKKVVAGYKKKEFSILPDRYNKTFEDWIYNIRDWCISRQLWWWHQIPAYYDIKTGELLAVTTDEESVYKKYSKEKVRRDDDVLDTWFSSALWPFAILGWDPKKPSDLYKKFYPAQVLETWHDIIFFWVTKMLLMAYEYTGEAPFHTIYLHWLVRDDKWRKMSKSLNNGIDPIEVINEYWADALRLTLTIGNTPGNNLNFSINNVEINSIFLNKLWNITRFVYANVWEIPKKYEELQELIIDNYEKLLTHEKWILQKIALLSEKVSDWMEKYNFWISWEELMAFTRDDFADFFIEEYKCSKEISEYWNELLTFVLLTILKLWHPYIPFVTEELYSKLKSSESIIDSIWPKIRLPKDSKTDKNVNLLHEVIRVIRNIRATKWIKPWNNVDVIFVGTKSNLTVIDNNELIIKWLAKVDKVSKLQNFKNINEDDYVYWVAGNIDIFVDLGDTVDNEEEKLRIKTQIEDKKDYIRKLDSKLLNADFIKNAPEQLVRSEQEKRRQAQELLEKLQEKYNKINN